MDTKIRAGIITGYGINADLELAEAFQWAGAETVFLHIKDLISEPGKLETLHILGFPGGFSFGDHLGSGLVLAHLFRKHLREELDRFVDRGKLVIGICNGFQVLVKMGFLPNLRGRWEPAVSLIGNESGVFQDQWVPLSFNNESPCVWTQNLENMLLPIRHGEGRFVCADKAILGQLGRQNLIAVSYDRVNPNGSQENIAGICDKTGRILGLMPHPEAYLYPYNHPQKGKGSWSKPLGTALFFNAVQHFR